MTDITFISVFVAILVVGVMSIYWVIRGTRSITDQLISKLFKYIQALFVALVAVSLLFTIWISMPQDLIRPQAGESDLLLCSFLIAISALMLGSSFAVKKIGEAYGFKVKDK